MSSFMYDLCEFIAELSVKGYGVTWRVSSKWVNRNIDCTFEGIRAGCMGKCCHGPTYYPGRVSDDNKCVHLTDEGCRLKIEDKPIICLLYPLMLNSSNTLILHYRALAGPCKKNYRKGPKIIEAMKTHLIELFGEANTNYIINSTNCGIDPTFDVPSNVLEGIVREDRWAELNEKPQPRSDFEKERTVFTNNLIDKIKMVNTPENLREVIEYAKGIEESHLKFYILMRMEEIYKKSTDIIVEERDNNEQSVVD